MKQEGNSKVAIGKVAAGEVALDLPGRAPELVTVGLTRGPGLKILGKSIRQKESRCQSPGVQISLVRLTLRGQWDWKGANKEREVRADTREAGRGQAMLGPVCRPRKTSD